MRPALDLGLEWQQSRLRASGHRGGAGGDSAAAPTGRKSVPGLAQLVEETLGLPLDKAMRMSNWARRPLVAAQTEYAALDAHCLVRLFTEWERRRLRAAAPTLFADADPPPGAPAAACCVVGASTSLSQVGADGAPSVAVRVRLLVGRSFAAALV